MVRVYRADRRPAETPSLSPITPRLPHPPVTPAMVDFHLNERTVFRHNLFPPLKSNSFIMNRLLHDLRFGLRQARRNPGFAALVILMLALGIGANTAIFSVINTVLIRPLPYRDPTRLVSVDSTPPAAVAKIVQADRFSATYADFRDWRRLNNVFDGLAALAPETGTLLGGAEPEHVEGAQVSDDFFRLLGVQPVLGRVFLPEEFRPDRSQVVILGHQLWRRHFSGRADALGQPLRFGGKIYTVVGVMPPAYTFNFKFLALKGIKIKPEVWTPVSPSTVHQPDRNHFFSVIARLRAGVSVENAQAEMTDIAGRLEQARPQNRGWRVVVEPLKDTQRGEYRLPLLTLFAGVSVVLLIACINIVNLLLAHNSSRQSEMAVRASLGATRWQITTQLLAESVWLCGSGSLLGLILAFGAVRLINNFRLEFDFDWPVISIDSTVLVFTLSVAALTAAIFGLLPAMRTPNMGSGLKEAVRTGTAGKGRARFASILVVSELALALLLLIGAGLLTRSFLTLRHQDPGYRSAGILTMTTEGTKQEHLARFPHLLERLASLPGVQSAALTSNIPASGGGYYWGFQIAGREVPFGPQMPHAQMAFVSPEFFATMAIPLNSGRILSTADTRDRAPVVIISQTLARKYWGDADPVGQKIRLDNWRTVVGVVGDVRQDSLTKLPEPQAYIHYQQYFQGNANLVIRTRPDPLSLAGVVRKEVRAACPDQPIVRIRTMDKVLGEDVASPRLVMSLMTGFSALATCLAAIGVFGVIARSVSERRQEISVRMALGARPVDVMRLVIGRVARLMLAGLLIGLALALPATRLMASLLFGVTPADPGTFSAMIALLVAVALAAGYIPARRAARIDPLVGLRSV